MSCCAWFRLSVVYIMERWKTLDRSGIRAYLQTHMRGQSSLGSIHRGVSGLLGDRLGVRPIDKKPSQSPWLRQRKPACHAAGALHDTPGGLLPFQKVAVRGCESMLINPLPSRLVAAVKRYYTPFGQESLGRQSHISKVRTGLLLWGPPPIITTLPWLAPWPRPVLPTKGKTQCDPYIRSTRQMKSNPPPLASSPQFKTLLGVCPSCTYSSPMQQRSCCTPPRREAANSSARPSSARSSLRGVVGEAGLSAVRTPGVPSCHCAACAANWQAVDRLDAARYS